jgi:Flp pilus assembly secretin CpaC
VNACSLFSKLGVDLKPPESVFYNDRLGLLFVRASLPDLDTIENVLSALNDSAPQIHIKARFIEVPGPVVPNLNLESFNTASTHLAGDDNPEPTRDTLNRPKFTASGSTSFTGIMSESQFQAALRTLESTPGVEVLAEPEVTTISGRQTEMRATQIVTVVTNFALVQGLNSQSDSITPQTTKLEFGPVLDVIPNVLADGYTIDLRAIASVKEGLGYDRATNTIPVWNELGEQVYVPKISPSFVVRKATANIKLWDNQTVVLSGMKAQFYDGGKEVGTEPDHFTKTKAARSQPDRENKDLFVFITVTLVDAAGNRIHSGGDMPFPKNRIPLQ